MRRIALGLFAAAGIALAIPAIPAIPASAQGVSVGVGPGGVGVGVHEDRDRDRDHRRRVIRERHRECRTVIIREHGMTRKIRRCR